MSNLEKLYRFLKANNIFDEFIRYLNDHGKEFKEYLEKQNKQ
jgi:hypothetical protein